MQQLEKTIKALSNTQKNILKKFPDMFGCLSARVELVPNQAINDNNATSSSCNGYSLSKDGSLQTPSSMAYVPMPINLDFPYFDGGGVQLVPCWALFLHSWNAGGRPSLASIIPSRRRHAVMVPLIETRRPNHILGIFSRIDSIHVMVLTNYLIFLGELTKLGPCKIIKLGSRNYLLT